MNPTTSTGSPSPSPSAHRSGMSGAGGDAPSPSPSHALAPTSLSAGWNGPQGPYGNGYGHGNSPAIVTASATTRVTPFPGRRPAVLKAPPNAAGLLKALRRRWKLATVIGCVLAVICGLGAWRLIPPPRFHATTILRVPTQKMPFLFDTKHPTYQPLVHLVTRRKVLNSALRKPSAAQTALVRDNPDPLTWLEKNLTVHYDGLELRIMLAGDTPGDLPALVNAVTAAYMSEVENTDKVAQNKRHEDLKEIYDNLQLDLESKQKSIRQLKDLVGPNEETATNLHRNALESLGAAEKEMAQFQSRLRQLRVTYDVELQRRDESLESGADSIQAQVEERIRTDAKALAFRDAYQRIESARTEAKRIARSDNDASVQRYDRDLERKRAEQNAYLSELRTRLTAAVRIELARKRNPKLAEMEHEIKVYQEQIDALAEEIKSKQQNTSAISRNSNDVAVLEEEIGKTKGIADQIGIELKKLEVELKAPSPVELVESADPESVKFDDSKRLQIAAMASFGGFGLSLLVVAFWEFRSRRIHSLDEVAYDLGLELIGTIPRLPMRALSPGVGQPKPRDQYWQGLLNESVDTLRTNLLHLTRLGQKRVIMVASAVPREGKTSLSSHLAMSLARSGRSTLLIDCDLRRPTIHRLFDQPLSPGFSDVLRSLSNVDDVVHSTNIDNLTVIAAGECTPAAVQALSQQTAEAFFRELKTRFDYIVIDTSPLLPVADALVLAQYVDGVIFSVMRHVSRSPKVYEATQQLQKLGVPVLGTVVTGATGTGNGYGYGYGYGYAYNQGYGYLDRGLSASNGTSPSASTPSPSSSSSSSPASTPTPASNAASGPASSSGSGAGSGSGLHPNGNAGSSPGISPGSGPGSGTHHVPHAHPHNTHVHGHDHPGKGTFGNGRIGRGPNAGKY